LKSICTNIEVSLHDCSEDIDTKIYSKTTKPLMSNLMRYLYEPIQMYTKNYNLLKVIYLFY